MVITLEEKIRGLLDPIATGLGYNIVRVKTIKRDILVVEILIERINFDKVNIADCKKFSKAVSVILNVDGCVGTKYTLEISSPGVERPLITLEDYSRFVGSTIKVKLNNPIDGLKKYCGEIISVNGTDISLKSQEGEIVVPYSNIGTSNIVLTEEGFRKLLNREVRNR